MKILKQIWNKIKEIMRIRLIFMTIIALILFTVLAIRMYNLQILEATETTQITSSASSNYKSEVTRYTESTRGNIYDRNGNLLAYNVQSFSVVMTNNATVTTNEQKNTMIKKLIDILEKHGNQIEIDFPIVYDGPGEVYTDENGELVDEGPQFKFTVSGTAELRFKKNAYGLPSISKLSDEQRDASATEVYKFLKKGNKSVAMFGISDDYSVEDSLKIMAIRYTLFTLYPQYSQFTLCSDVDEKTIAAIRENEGDIPGVEVKSQFLRVYNDSIYFAHILGYTGQANEDEVEALNEGLIDSMYSTSDIVGKTGIEKELDSVLRGKKGQVSLTLNSANRILSQTVGKPSEAGNDVYLTIDRELQIACYHILENNISAILRSKIVNSDSYGGKGDNASKITIPICEVYNAFFDNEMLDLRHFNADDASALEQKVAKLYQDRYALVRNNLYSVLSFDTPIKNSSLSDEMKKYIDYIYSMLKNEGVVIRENINTKDKVYLDYQDGKISLSEYLQYGINNDWIDLGRLGISTDYRTNKEIYNRILEFIFEEIKDDNDFEKLIYRVLVFGYKITGRECCLLLYDQGVLEYNENDYARLNNGNISPYDFVMEKLTNLEITPGMLALEPCSGSIVITDPNNGDVLAEVTYPSYDINKLANKIDYEYYRKLIKNKATPLLSRPTQQMTTTGSTFKPLMSLAGLGEGIISVSTQIQDKGIFEEVDPSPKCWKYPGNHSWITLTQAIQHSCNYFFYDVGYKMSLDSNQEYSDSLGLSKIQKYASMFGLNAKSGVEVPESQPTISTTDAVRTSIGYYHSFAPIQIARYVTAIANKGTVYNLTLVDKTVNEEKKLVVNNAATVYNNIDIYSDSEWNAVQKGMFDVVNTSANSLNKLYGDLGFYVAGKTGTAQVSLTHPSHGLFISFAPYEKPEIAVTVVLPNGYASANAAKLAREVYGLYFNEENKEALLSGDMTTTTVTNITVSD